MLIAGSPRCTPLSFVLTPSWPTHASVLLPPGIADIRCVAALLLARHSARAARSGRDHARRLPGAALHANASGAVLYTSSGVHSKARRSHFERSSAPERAVDLPSPGARPSLPQAERAYVPSLDAVLALLPLSSRALGGLRPPASFGPQAQNSHRGRAAGRGHGHARCLSPRKRARRCATGNVPRLPAVPGHDGMRGGAWQAKLGRTWGLSALRSSGRCAAS